MVTTRTREGGCHCGAVRFEAQVPEPLRGGRCNCSICAKKGVVMVHVALDGLEVTRGADIIATYSFNTGVAKHTFCSVCGVKAFYRPRSNPDGWSVNARCLDEAEDLELVMVEPFDGRNWEAYAQAHDLSHLSKEPA